MTRISHKSIFLGIVFVLSALVGACGSGGEGSGGGESSSANIATVEIQQTGLVLTESGATRQLSAVAYDAQGNPLAASFSWTATTPADIAVDSGGKVTAKKANGSSQIIATAGGVKSAPLLAVVTELPVGAIPLTDAQIVGDPVDNNPPDAEPSFYNTYQVVLTGIAVPSVGDLLINTESKPVAGKVVAVDTTGGKTTVTLRLVSLRQMFPNLNIKETLDLSQAPVTINPELEADYDIERNGNTYTFKPKSSLSPLVSSLFGAAAVPAAAPSPSLGPLSECKTDLSTIPFQLSTPPLFTVSQNFNLDLVYTQATGLERFIVSGEVKPKIQIGMTVTVAFEAKVECTAELFAIRIPVGGPLSFFVAGLIPIKVGFEAGGKVTIADAGLGFEAESTAAAKAGVECPNGADCAFVGEVTGGADAKPVVNLPSYGDRRFEPSLEIFGEAEIAIGSPFLKKLRLDTFYARGGPKLEGSFAPRLSQILDTDYKSDYKLSLEGKAGIGKKFGEAMKLLGLETVSLLEFTRTVEIAKSPAVSSVTANRATFVADDPVNFHVTLDAGTVNFYPLLGPYNVDEIVLVRYSGGSDTEEVGRVPAVNGQTEFDIPYTATGSGNVNEFTAFVVTNILPFDIFLLELGTATPQNYIVDVQMPAQIPASSSAPVTVTVTKSENGGAPVPAADIFVSLSASCGSISPASGTTSSAGTVTATVTPDEGCSSVSVTAIVRTSEGTSALAQDTAAASVNAAAGMDLTGSYVGVIAWGGNGAGRIVHTGSVTQTQNAISGTFAAKDISGSFTATLTSDLKLVNTSLTVNGSTMTVTGASATDDHDGQTSLNYSSTGGFTFDGNTTSGNVSLSLTGRNCAFENLNESGSPTQYSYMQVHRGGEWEAVPLTGWASITATSATVTFAGGGISGSLTGSVQRPQTGIAMVIGDLSLCGQTGIGGAFVSNGYAGFEFYMTPNGTCANEGTVTEVRFRIQPSAGGLGVFCR